MSINWGEGEQDPAPFLNSIYAASPCTLNYNFQQFKIDIYSLTLAPQCPAFT